MPPLSIVAFEIVFLVQAAIEVVLALHLKYMRLADAPDEMRLAIVASIFLFVLVVCLSVSRGQSARGRGMLMLMELYFFYNFITTTLPQLQQADLHLHWTDLSWTLSPAMVRMLTMARFVLNVLATLMLFTPASIRWITTARSGRYNMPQHKLATAVPIRSRH